MKYLFVILFFVSCSSLEKSKSSKLAVTDSLTAKRDIKTDSLSEGSKRTETNTSHSTGSYERETETRPIVINLVDSGRSRPVIVPMTRTIERGTNTVQTQQVIIDTTYKQEVNSVLTELTNRLLRLEDTQQKQVERKPNNTPFFIMGGVFLLCFAGLLWYVDKRFVAIKKTLVETKVVS